MQRRTYVVGISLLALVALGVPEAAVGQALSQPDGWRTRAERFVAMPPGFHITTSPSVLFFHPDARAEGEFYVQSEGFLFRGDSPHSYGLFIGGRDLEGDDASWTSFEIAHDGTWAVRTRRFRDVQQGAEVVDVLGPEPGPVALPGAETTAKNELVIRAGAEEVAFEVNDQTVATLPRADLPVDGVVGFRVGADLNLHLTSLTIGQLGGDHLERWAPTAAAPEEGGP